METTSVFWKSWATFSRKRWRPSLYWPETWGDFGMERAYGAGSFGRAVAVAVVLQLAVAVIATDGAAWKLSAGLAVALDIVAIRAGLPLFAARFIVVDQSSHCQLIRFAAVGFVVSVAMLGLGVPPAGSSPHEVLTVTALGSASIYPVERGFRSLLFFFGHPCSG